MSKTDSKKNNLAQQLISHIKAAVDDASVSDSDASFRTLFQKEYDKVIFSDYFRALSDKTQVVPLSEQDHNHNRLTHSIEVASVGRSFGFKLFRCLNDVEGIENKECLAHLPTILETACLLHDIGNPPFGHAGEDAIKQTFRRLFQPTDNTEKEFKYGTLIIQAAEYDDFLRFDGNANGFRISTRLAGRRSSGGSPNVKREALDTGLGLSRVTLAAGIKYPFSSCKQGHPAGKEKFGFFEAEYPIFEWVSQILPNETDHKREAKGWHKRHPLVFFVEAADDICNLVMDFEDAIKNGHTQPKELLQDVIALLKGSDASSKFLNCIPHDPADNISKEAISETKAILDFDDDERVISLLRNLAVLSNYDSNKHIFQEELKAIEAIRAESIGMLIKSIWRTFEAHIDDICRGELKIQDKQVGLLDQHFNFKGLSQPISNLRRKYLDYSLYCQKRKAAIEISGYQITEFLLTIFLNAVSEYKNQCKFTACSTKSQHLLRYLGICEHTQLADDELTGYQLCLRVIDFYTKASDKEVSLLYRCLSGH